MVPDYVDIGGLWRVLPPGVHTATIEEVEARFAVSDHRRKLFSGLIKGIDVLKKAGCRVIYLNGSYVTEKPFPKDYDICWSSDGVDLGKLDPILLDFSEGRKRQKEHYYGEYFPAETIADRAQFFYDFFQNDKDTGQPKGIIKINIA